MKTRQRSIKYNGLDIKLDIDINSLISNEKEKYKPEIAILKKNITSRDNYIKKLHGEIKKTENAMYVFIMCCRIHDKVKELYNISYGDYMILSYISEIDHVNTDRIIKYFKTLDIQISKYRLKKMIEFGYVNKSPKSGYVYITDIGKKVVTAVVGAMKQDYSYYMNKRFSKKKILIHSRKENYNKYTEEERENRAKYYRVMMKPFWDSDIKKIPRDAMSRYILLKKWMAINVEDAKDPIYTKLLNKWFIASNPVSQ